MTEVRSAGSGQSAAIPDPLALLYTGAMKRKAIPGRDPRKQVSKAQRREAVPWDEVMRGLAGRRADPALLDELRALVSSMTVDSDD